MLSMQHCELAAHEVVKGWS